jgi:hypothetical protein
MRRIMESRILGSLGKVAGLGGVALGVFLLIFRGVLEKQFLPQAGLTAEQAFAVLPGWGVVAWLISRSGGRKESVSLPRIGILVGVMP